MYFIFMILIMKIANIVYCLGALMSYIYTDFLNSQISVV